MTPSEFLEGQNLLIISVRRRLDIEAFGVLEPHNRCIQVVHLHPSK